MIRTTALSHDEKGEDRLQYGVSSVHVLGKDDSFMSILKIIRYHIVLNCNGESSFDITQNDKKHIVQRGIKRLRGGHGFQATFRFTRSAMSVLTCVSKILAGWMHLLSNNKKQTCPPAVGRQHHPHASF